MTPDTAPPDRKTDCHTRTGGDMEAAQSTPTQQLAHYGFTGELFAISLINLLLKVVTLGIYHFWGKTRVRRYVWSHTSFAGEQFEYVGRGGELLRGYAIAMAIIIPLGAAWQFLIEFYADNPLIVAPVSLVGYTAFLFFSGLALFSSRRYMLSRTRWRGVRFGLSGSAIRHGRKMLVYSILVVLTGGIYFPFMRSNLFAHLMDNSWMGDRRFSYAGRGSGLLIQFIWFALLTILIIGMLFFANLNLVQSLGSLQSPEMAGTAAPAVLIAVIIAVTFAGYAAVGINWLWYRAREFRYFVDNTSVDGVQVRADFSTRGYIWLWISNMVLLLITLGLAYAWVVVRTARFLTTHLQLEGALELAAIAQTSQQVPKSGEARVLYRFLV